MGALRAGFHGTVGQPSAQVIDGSLKFHGDKAYYLKKTPYVGNRKTWTISFWVKRCEGSATEPGIFSTYAGVSGPAFTCYFNSSDNLRIYNDESGYNLNLVTAQVFRDYNSWYHIVISIDTTASDKAKLYVNGVRVTEFSTELYPGDIDLDWNTATEHNIGKHLHEYDGNISNFYHIDGHSFGPEYFGFTDPLTNTWRPKKLEQFPKRSFTNPRWYSSATVYTSVADVVANATDRGNGGVTVTNEYCYLVFNDGGYGTSGGEVQSPDYPVWTDVASFSGITRVFYYDSNEADNWKNAGSFTSSASEWNQWRYSNASSHETYRISPYMGIENGNMLVYCANGTIDNPTTAGTLASITLPTFDTNSFHFQNAAVDTWYTGGNSFYLPLDGNSLIGEDKFGNGNDWTPVSFGGSNTIEKATGALPILNTTNGGNTATVGVRTDAFASNLVLALPLVGGKDDVSNQINSGSGTKSVAANDSVGASDAQSNFYGGSFYFDGNTSETAAKYLEVASGLNFSQDFTVEMWFYKTTTLDYGVLFDCWNGQTSGDGWYSWFNGGTIDIVKDSSTYYYDSSDPVILDDTWNHVAYVRDNNVFKLFLNGVFQYSFNITDNWTSTKCWIGSGQGNASMSGFYGYIQDVRIYQTAKYTENFIPASTNPDILPDTPSGVSGGSELAKITDGSVYFDGTDDYLEIADNTDFELGTGDFTIEAFIYNPVDAVQSIIAKYDNGNSVRSFWLGTITLNNPSFYWYSGNNVYNINGGAGTLPTNKWSHIVAQRTSGNMYLFIDGKVVNSDTTADAAVSLNNIIHPLRIGSDTHEQGLEFEGHISNVRIVKGTGVYNTSGFTPLTEPLTNVTNTTLLCCQSNTDVTEGAVKPADVSWIPTGYTYWSGMNDNWDVSGTTTSDISATGDGDWIATSLPTSGKYYFETIVNNPGQYRVLGFTTGQSGAGANYLDNMFGYYFNGTGSPPLFLAKNPGGTDRSSEAANSGFAHGNTSELTFHDGDILMWGWDADNDKIYFGLNGTWYNNGDPVAGTGHIVSGEDLSASSFYLKVGYMNSGGHSLNKLSLTNVPSSESGSSSSIVSSREISNFNLVNKASNFNPFNTDINTVRGQETGYATLNPLATQTSGTLTLSNGNLTATIGGTRTSAYASLPFVGKMYYEVTFVYDRAYVFGMAPSIDFNTTADTLGQRFIGESSGSYGASDDGNAWNNLVNTSIESFAVGDCMGWAYDSNSGEYSIFKNGINIGTFTADTSRTYYPAITMISSGAIAELNFGQKPFKFPPPDGYGPVNAANGRPETVITHPDQYVGVTTYTGNAPIGSTNTQSFNIGFKPDLVWIKSRDAARNHRLTDTVRDVGKELYSDIANPEGTVTDGVTSFTDNGFVLGANNNYNYTEGYVAWCWKAGGNSNTYNVDNVGYSTSTDINMSVGALTSVSYDQSQTWSNLDTYPNSYSPTTPANLFNGVVSTGEADFWYSAGASTVRFDNLVDQLPDIVNTIELYVFDRNGIITVTVNGVGATNYANTSSYKWIKLTPNKKIVTLTVSGNDTVYWGIGAIKINGVMLANAGVTPASVPSIAPTGCSVGTKQGFSIVGYEGNSVSNTYIPHGLTKKPQFILVKNRTDNFYWHVYHAGMGHTKYTEIINTSTFTDNSNYWVQEPTDNVFTVGIANGINANGHQHIAYLWHDVPGLQKFGTYAGNADADGPFIELGFRPAVVWVKNASTDGYDWVVQDSERQKHNPVGEYLLLNSNNQFGSGFNVDFLSNGFKIRNANGNMNRNANNDLYVYCAWAEAPSINLYGGASNAR